MSKHTNNRGLRATLSDLTSLPLEAVGRAPLFQMFSDREMIIEGAEILEYYDDSLAKIRSGGMSISVGGTNLIIKCLANKNIAVSGRINNIEIENVRESVI